MKPIVRTALLLATTCLFADSAAGQRLNPGFEINLRTGRQADARRREAAAAKDQAAISELARALQHPEFGVRSKVVYELLQMARQEQDISAAVPALRQQVAGSWQYSLELRRMLETLVLVERDPTAKMLAGRVAAGGADSHLALNMLDTMDEVSVNLDQDLFPALDRTKAMTARQQVELKFREGQLLYVVARLATDRPRAGKTVLSRMRLPLDAGNYTNDHFLAVRRCAEHCGPLLPGLLKYYRDDVQRSRVLVLISALAVHDDDAWKFFSQYLQDRFASGSTKEQMASAYAHTWMLASDEARQKTRPKIATLNQAVPDWQTWGSASRTLVAPLHSDYDGFDKDRQVMNCFRKLTGYQAQVQATPDFARRRGR